MYLVRNIPILPFKKFVLPGDRVTIGIRNQGHIELIERFNSSNKEFGLPFFFNGKFNVYGCSVSICKVYRNEKKGFLRVTLAGNNLFRIKQYNKFDNVTSFPSAAIKWINNVEHPVEDPEIIKLFEKYCNAIALIDNTQISVIDMMRELRLEPETNFSIITQENRDLRNDLIKKILRFKLLLRSQRNTFIFN